MHLGSGGRGRGLVWLTAFCLFVMLAPASAADPPASTSTDAPANTSTDPAATPAASPPPEQDLVPNPPPGPADSYGSSTALSGNTAAVGAPGASAGAGSVTVFTVNDNGTATQRATITPPAPDQSGFGTAVSTDGQTLAVGAPGNSQTQAVDLYDPATAALLAQLLGTDALGPNTGFGSAVALDGDWLAVGAPDYSSYYSEGDGAVVIYQRIDGVWSTTPFQVLYGPGGSSFGTALDLNGTTLVIGAPFEQVPSGDSSVQAGAVHVYALVNGEGGPVWAEVDQPLTDPNPINGEEFGAAVAVDGGIVAVGIPNSLNEAPGSVILFGNQGGGGAVPIQTIDGPAGGYSFGRSLALDAGTLAVGYLQPDLNGAVNLYQQGGSVPSSAFTPGALGLSSTQPFVFQGTQQGSGSSYGKSLSASGGRVLIGDDGAAHLLGATTVSPGGGGGGNGGGGPGPTKGSPKGSPSGGPGGGGGAAGSAGPAQLAVAALPTVTVPPHPAGKPPATEHQGTEPGQPGGAEGEGPAPEADRSSFAERVLSPLELDLSFTNLAEGGILAFILAALLYLPVIIFNKTTEKNHAVITGWLAGPRRAMDAAVNRIPFARNPLALLMATGVVSGFLFSFVEPGFPGRAGSLQYLVGMILGFVLIAVVFFGTWREVVHRLEPESEGRWRLYPPYIALALMLIVLSRLAHFLPGVVLGTLAEYEPGKRLKRRTAGLRVLFTYSALLVVGGAAWFAWIPVEQAAREPGASSITLILDAMLSVIFVTGLESTVFGLIPLTFLDGNDLFRWKKPLWLLLWGFGLYWFSVVILHPALSTYNEVSSAGVFWFAVLFGSLLAVALSTWAFFTLRQARLRSSG